MANTEGAAEEEVLIAQVESYVERKDYQRKGRCVRFTAIKEGDLTNLDGSEGVTTITVDLSYWQFCYSILGNKWLTESVRRKIDSGEIVSPESEKAAWYLLKVSWNEKPAHGYAYRTFSEDEPKYFSLISCAPIAEPSFITKGRIYFVTGKKPSKRAMSAIPSIKFGNGHAWTLWTFHVGQGMCSLLTDGQKHGILLDAGAGTPVVRPNYINKRNVMRNDLLSKLLPLESVDLVLSHADADHWRLLAWDEILRDKVQYIYVPDNAKSLALKDKVVIKKVREVIGFTYQLSGGGVLKVLRSKPATKHDNTDCLVALYISSDGVHLALQSGDYVYEDMKLDGNPSISSLDKNSYAAIVVPHHGDSASAKAVFKPRLNNQSIAFFSAGDHRYYNHPTPESRTAHQLAQFRTIWNKNITYIHAVQLIP